MELLPLNQLRLDRRSHWTALWWIGITYLRPREIELAGERTGFLKRTVIAFWIILHAIPYLALLCGVGRFLQGMKLDWHLPWGLAVGLIVGLVLAFIYGLATGVTAGLTLGVSYGITAGGGHDWVHGLTLGLACGFLTGIVDVDKPKGPSGRPLLFFSGCSVFFGIMVGIIFNISVGVAGGLSTLFSSARLYYLPVHACFLCWKGLLKNYRYHPVVWDDVCLLPFPGLDSLLLRYAELDPRAGGCEIDRLIDSYPSQRNAALRAKALLLGRQAAEITDLAALDELLAVFPEGKKDFLADIPEYRRRVHEIATLQARIDILDRAFLREPFAALLVKTIEAFEQQIAGFRQPLSAEFRKAARNWLNIARKQHETARSAVLREPTRQVFRAGDPVDREKEAFVERAGILGELERQVMLAAGCPGLLVYGRRRVGKSSLLRNLEGFLPPGVLIANLSMQEARAFTSLADWIGLLAERISSRVPGVVVPISPVPGLKDLGSLLAEAEKQLEAAGRRLLLAVDEYENLDRKIGDGVFPEDFLAVLRESMQGHRRLIWTLAGSHRIDELTHAPWASYLVSARTVEVPPFEPAETRLLLTEPLKHSSLWRAAGSEAPRFEPGFWGPGGIERIQAETGGWPHLVQLVAERVVDAVNDAGVEGADAQLLERALDRAVEHGYSVFYELIDRESTLPGELDYLRRFARAETQPIPEDDAVDRSLRRRLLVVPEGAGYRLRAPIMGRWLRR